MKFTEDTRVKIPAILHLIRPGYSYLSLKTQTWHKETNIFPDIFTPALARINLDTAPDDIERVFKDTKLLLDWTDAAGVGSVHDNVQSVHAHQAVLVLWLQHYRAKKMGSRFCTREADLSFFGDILQQSKSLISLSPYIGSLVEGNAILSAILEYLLDS